jgi:hypothetical protein
MMPGIRIIPSTRRNRLDKMSRVDFSRMYIIEHNVKVFDFGTVHRSHMQRLQSQLMATITDVVTGGQSSPFNMEEGNKEEEGEDDEDEDMTVSMAPQEGPMTDTSIHAPDPKGERAGTQRHSVRRRSL